MRGNTKGRRRFVEGRNKDRRRGRDQMNERGIHRTERHMIISLFYLPGLKERDRRWW